MIRSEMGSAGAGAEGELEELNIEERKGGTNER